MEEKTVLVPTGNVFMLPLTLKVIDLKYSGALVSAVATFAAIQEGHYIRTVRCDICYNSNQDL